MTIRGSAIQSAGEGIFVKLNHLTLLDHPLTYTRIFRVFPGKKS